MNLSFRFAIFIAFSLLVTLTSCVKEPKQVVVATKYELPPISYNGLNTGGLLLRDTVFVLNPRYLPSIEHSKDIIHYVFTLSADKLSYYQVFHIQNFHGVGSYKIPEECDVVSSKYIDDGRYWGLGESIESYDASYFSGYLNIFYIDTVKRITAGIYEYTIVDSTFQNGDTVRIRDGRFDFKY